MVQQSYNHFGGQLMRMGTPELRKTKVAIHLDTDEAAILSQFRKLRQHGFGRLEVAVVNGKLDVIYHTKTFKQQDVVSDENEGLVQLDE